MTGKRLRVGIGAKRYVYCIVSPEDHASLRKRTWRLNRDGYVSTIYKDGGSVRTLKLHRIVLGLERGDERHGDHINRDRLDNRRENLRITTASENYRNRFFKGRTGFKGVKPLSSGKFCAQIRCGTRLVWLGTFPSAEAAARAYDRAVIERDGDTALLNYPDSLTEANDVTPPPVTSIAPAVPPTAGDSSAWANEW